MNHLLSVPPKYQLKPFNHLAKKAVFPLSKASKAAILYDANKLPEWFIFNTSAILDVLSKIDETLIDKMSTEDYYNKKTNPAGWLIDEIEATVPLKEDFVESLKDAIEESNREGWIPWEEVLKDLQK